jgi:hypothetical protein
MFSSSIFVRTQNGSFSVVPVLHTVSDMMKNQSRNTLLLVEKQSFTHSVTEWVSNVTTEFLPPNVTSEVQLLDQGNKRAEQIAISRTDVPYSVTMAGDSTTKSDCNQ